MYFIFYFICISILIIQSDLIILDFGEIDV